MRLQRQALLDFVFDGVLVEFGIGLFEVEVADEFQRRAVAAAIVVVAAVVGMVACSVVTLAALLWALVACLLLVVVVVVAAVHAAGRIATLACTEECTIGWLTSRWVESIGLVRLRLSGVALSWTRIFAVAVVLRGATIEIVVIVIVLLVLLTCNATLVAVGIVLVLVLVHG